jgi:DNA-binding MarR family transcriptional regulator
MGSKASREDDATVVVESFRRLVRELRSSAHDAQRRAGVSAAQLFVLEQLRDGDGVSLGELAARTLTHPSSVSVVVQRLVDARLVTRTRAPDDARRLQVELTPAARAMLRKSPPSFQERLIEAVSKLPPAKRRALSHGLRTIVESLGLHNHGPAEMFFEDRS